MNRGTLKKSVIVCLVVGGLAAAIWSWRSGKQDAARKTPDVTVSDRLRQPPPPPGGYAGSMVCAECHQAIASSYAQHPMAHSLSAIGDADTVEDYRDATTFAPSAPRRYRVERTTEGVFHHEVGVDRQGEVIYDQAVEVSYAVGSGRRGRSYLIDRGEYLFLSPISWYSQEGRWDLSPGYSPDKHPRFGRLAYDRCLQCHAGRMNYHEKKTSQLVQRYGEPPFAEPAIGCERCHGPAAEHVRRQRNAVTAGEDTIVNPARLAPDRRDSVCNQCHLQGESQILRFGRSHDDYRAGDHLGDVWSVFVAGKTGVDDDGLTVAVSQAQQMYTSSCYRGSAGKLSCTSCHDPHRYPAEEERVAFFRERCLNCHDPDACAVPRQQRLEREALDSCIACHMPRLSANDVPHTTQTDHRIRRSPDQGDPSQERADRRPLEIFDLADCPLPEIELQRARGLMMAERAEVNQNVEYARQAERLLQGVRQAAPEDVETLDALALCSAVLGRPDDAVRLWNQVLGIDPTQLDALFSLTVYFYNIGDVVQSARYARRYLDVNPWRAEMWVRQAHLLAQMGQLEAAIASAEKAIELDPSAQPPYAGLVRLHAQRGELNAARRSEDLLRRLTESQQP